MPSDPDTICKNGAPASRRCLSFSPAYRFGDGHAPIPDRSFILSCWQPLMILVIKKGQCQQPQLFPGILFLGRVMIFFHPLDNNVVATFVSHCMITKYVLVSELVKIFYLTNLALGVALFTSIPPHIYSSSCTPPQHIRPQYRSFHEICVLK